jgi:hypothetical protein
MESHTEGIAARASFQILDVALTPKSTNPAGPSKKISPPNSPNTFLRRTAASTSIAPSSASSRPFPPIASPTAVPPPSATSVSSFFSASPALTPKPASQKANSTRWSTSRVRFFVLLTRPNPTRNVPLELSHRHPIHRPLPGPTFQPASIPRDAPANSQVFFIGSPKKPTKSNHSRTYATPLGWGYPYCACAAGQSFDWPTKANQTDAKKEASGLTRA